MCVCLVVSTPSRVCVCVRIWIMFLFWPFYQKIFFLFSSQCQNKKKKKCLYLITLSVSERPTARLFYFPKKMLQTDKKKQNKTNKRDMEFFLGYWSNFLFLLPFLSSPPPPPWMENNNKPKWELCNVDDSWIWQ